MQIRNIQQEDLSHKTVLLRGDFNVKLEQGDVREQYKLRALHETLEYILSFEDSRIAIMSHLGRPDGIDPEYSLKQLVDDVNGILDCNVTFVPVCVGETVRDALKDATSKQRVFLLENVRFHDEEIQNNNAFAQKMAEPFDIFVNDAFSVCHRDQASVTGVAKHLPSFAGLQLQKELHELTRTKETPEHPAVAIIGGAKIQTKLPLIKMFEDRYDAILVGGKIANEALDENIVFSEKVHLPVDFVGDRFDIGIETIQQFKALIQGAKTIVWNGPMGKFEDEKYARGTREITEAMLASGAYTLAGGGESLEILEDLHRLNDISFISTGGGAMLEYLSGGHMPGLDVLRV